MGLEPTTPCLQKSARKGPWEFRAVRNPCDTSVVRPAGRWRTTSHARWTHDGTDRRRTRWSAPRDERLPVGRSVILVELARKAVVARGLHRSAGTSPLERKSSTGERFSGSSPVRSNVEGDLGEFAANRGASGAYVTATHDGIVDGGVCSAVARCVHAQYQPVAAYRAPRPRTRGGEEAMRVTPRHRLNGGAGVVP